MSDPKVPRHWIVAPWLATDPAVSPYGQPGARYSVVYGKLEDAKAQARAQAALAPGSVWVVYVATWYSWTDETPVNLQPVIGQAI
jgi:hypothetical protein